MLRELEAAIIRRNARRILKARHEAKAIGRKEANNTDRWGISNSGILSYQETFMPIFPKPPLRQWVCEQTRNGQGIIAVDIMGQGQVLREMPIKTGLAITLGDGRSDAQKDRDSKGNEQGERKIEVIAGDIMSKKTWAQINNWVMSNTPNGVNLVLCRPYGGIGKIAEVYNLYYMIINNMWHLLDPNNGLILTQMPLPYSSEFEEYEEYLGQWLMALKRSGVEYDYSIGLLRLNRKPNSPFNLPMLEGIRH